MSTDDSCIPRHSHLQPKIIVACQFLDLYIYIAVYNSQGKIFTKIYDTRNDFSSPIVNFSFLGRNISLAYSYNVYIFQLICYAGVCSDVSDFNERNLCITDKLLSWGFHYYKMIKAFTKFFHKYKNLVSKFEYTGTHLIKRGISHPTF